MSNIDRHARTRPSENPTATRPDMGRCVRMTTLSIVLAASTVLAMSCTRATLAPVPPPDQGRADNKLTVEGRFCTTDPDDIAFPVKLLFLIDTSASMNATDPEGVRVDALIDVINQVFDIPGVEIGIMPFAGGALSPTQ